MPAIRLALQDTKILEPTGMFSANALPVWR